MSAHLLGANRAPVVVVLVGNKSDISDRQVTQEEGEGVAKGIKAMYREASALTGNGVTEVFEKYLRATNRRTGKEEAVKTETKAGKTGGFCEDKSANGH
jgi:GTPase SAR1 family protein